MQIEQDVVSESIGLQYWFGSSVCISGNMAFVGAKNETVAGAVGRGAVYVFQRTPRGWMQIQKLLASDGQERDQFGQSLAIWGNTAVVTAPDASRNGMVWKGAAYVFTFKDGKWSESAILSVKGAAAFSNIGNSAAIGPSRILLGAGGSLHGGSYAPRRVHVFDYSSSARGGGWVHRQVLESPDPADTTSSFGASLGLSGQVAFIGARASTFDSQPGRGAVYVYEHSQGRWTLVQRLIANDGEARDNFGTSLCLQGDMAVIGSPGVNLGGGPSQGAVYVFRKRRGTWQQTQKIKGSDVLPLNLFGASVSLYEQSFNEKILLVGAYGADSYRGAAYLFYLGRAEWRELTKLVSSSGEAGDVFGYYTALSSDTALIGAYAATVDGVPQAGRASFFSL